MPLTTTASWDDAEDDAVFEGSIDCDPYDPDHRLRVPVANIQVTPGHRILALDPQELTDVAAKLRAQADRLHNDVLPQLIAAREDWANYLAEGNRQHERLLAKVTATREDSATRSTD